MRILVTGGAGYIGSFMVKRLLDDGHTVIVVDSLERGHKEAVDQRASFIEGSLFDEEFVEKFFLEQEFNGVIHFAGYIAVGESMQIPGLYFRNNIVSALNVLEAMRKNKINNFIFSSTATVYGTPIAIPIGEDHPKDTENPYGESKLMVEKILSWYNKIHNLNYVVLRYFNAAGAALDGSNGEHHDPETHLIPNAIKAALANGTFTLFGNDYKTHDGTGVRDYIHVLDLVDAHILSLQKIAKDGGGHTYNVGTGKGHSNKEVIAMVKKVSGVDFQVQAQGRRPGDIDVTIADAAKIHKELGFVPKYSDLETIVTSAWKWHKRRSENEK